jgi:predicted nucleotidyltransferase
MKTDLSTIRKKLSLRLPLLIERYKIKSLALFGSYVRCEQNDTSDLDILIEYQDIPDLISYIELENSLSDLLGIKVDLVMKDGLKPRIAQRILAEAVQV